MGWIGSLPYVLKDHQLCSEGTEVLQREGTPHARGMHYRRNSKDENSDDVGGVLVLRNVFR